MRDKSVPSGYTLKVRLRTEGQNFICRDSITKLTEQNIASKTGFE